MRKIFMPLVRVVQWFGRMLRLLWNRRSVGKSSPSNEMKTDTKVGTGALGIILTVVGIITAVTPSDMQQLETTMQQSFEKMEQLDYLAGPIEDSANYNAVLRGKAKFVSSMLREEFDYFNQLNFSAFDDAQVVPYCIQLIAGYSNRHTLMTSFEKDAATFLFKDAGTNYTYSIYFVHFSQLVQEREGLSEKLNKERKQMEEKLKVIANSPKVNKKKVAKISKQCVNSKTAMKYNQICFEEINLLYDCLVTMQLYETYGKQTMGNDLLKTLLEELKHQQNNNN